MDETIRHSRKRWLRRGAPRHSVRLGPVLILVLLSSSVAWADLIECKAGRTCWGTPEKDKLIGTESGDEVHGRAGSDLMKGLEAGDALEGGRGADEIQGGKGADVLDAGPIDDTPSIDSSDKLYGGGGNDEIHGGRNDYGWGRAGDDVLYGAPGRQTFNGGRGNDVMHGDEGEDYYIFGSLSGHDTIVDAPGKDGSGNTLWLLNVSADARINLSTAADRAEVKVPNHSATLQWDDNAIANVVDGEGDDMIRGNDLANLIFSPGGDTIYGRGGPDTLTAGYPGGHATIYGGRGDDTIDYKDDVAGEINGRSDVIDCGAGYDEVTYDALTDTVNENCEVQHPEE